MKMSESLERYAEAKEKDQKLRELWERQLANYEQSQKAHEERAARHEKAMWTRAILTLVMLGLIAITIIVAHFL